MVSNDRPWEPLASDVAPATSEPGAWTARSIYVLCMLTLVGSLNLFDRKLLNLVLPLLKDELRLTDTQLGLISGLAFALSYSLMGVPIARLADRREPATSSPWASPSGASSPRRPGW